MAKEITTENTINPENTINVELLGKNFIFKCPPHEDMALHKAAKYLHQQMQNIQNRGKLLHFDNIAIMAALNITHDLLSLREQYDKTEQNLQYQANRIEQDINQALYQDERASSQHEQ